MRPHLTLDIQQPHALTLSVTDSTDDLVLVVREPGGSFRCDDDSGRDRDPLLSIEGIPGRHAVWVGRFSGAEPARFTLMVRDGRTSAVSGTIAPSEAPRSGFVNLDELTTAPELRGRTETQVEGRALGADCRGYFGRAPELVVLNTVPRLVTVRARGRGRPTLIVRGPDGALRCASARRSVASVADRLGGGEHTDLGRVGNPARDRLHPERLPPLRTPRSARRARA